METLEIGLLHKAFVSQSKALLCLLALLLLMLAFLHSETLMPTIWHAIFTGFFEGPAFAFLLLNCLIVTIIASTKLESEEGGHEEASKRESMREGDGKGLFIAENVIRRGIVGQSHNSSITDGYDYLKYEGKDFVGSSCSLNQLEPINVSEKKPILRAYRVARTRSVKVGLLPNKPLSDLKEKKLMRGSFSFNDRAALEKSQKSNDNKGLGRAGNIIDHQSRQAEEPAAAAMTHPSLEEAWAAIMLAKKGDDRMANYMQAADQCIKGSNYGNHNQAVAAAAARTPPAAATDAPSPPAAAAPAPPAAGRTPPAAAAAAANPLRAAQAAPNPPGVPAAAMEKQEDADDHEHDSELEELNRRAEEFIARFNNQMRLQRQESLQRKGRHRTCNHSNHVQLPTPCLLVG